VLKLCYLIELVLPFKSVTDFEVKLSEEHELFRKSVREFAEKNVAPFVERGEKEGAIPEEALLKAKEFGLFGLGIPQEYGGQGGDVLSVALATEELSRVWASYAVRVMSTGLFATPILLFGSEEQKKKFVTPVARGEKTGAFANTEPSAGSDVAGITTKAERSERGYVLSGRKIFITNGGVAHYYVVSARTSPPSDKRWKGISLFVVERDTPGFRVVSRIETMGLRASNTAELVFEKAEVPRENLIGEEGMGFKYIMQTFDTTRVGVAAQAVGVAQAALERLVSYSIERHAFGAPIISYEMVQEKVAECLAELSAARLLTYWAASLMQSSKIDQAIVAASIAKLLATEIAERIALRSMIVHGGYGVSSGGVERLLRDVEIMKTYEGTNDIQKLIIVREAARRLLGLQI